MRFSTRIAGVTLSTLCLCTWACSSAPKKEEDPLEKQNAELKNQLVTLNTRLEAMESKMSSLADKVDTTKNNVESIMHVQKPKTTGVSTLASEGMGASIDAATAATDPETGFINDASIKSYRQAMILFQAQKYPEAILAFSTFLERYADHPFAGSAQFYVGESYYRQKEYKLALQEYQRVLTSYDRSSHVTYALKQMAVCETQLKRTQDAATHRQFLSSLFPQSPAANPSAVVEPSEKVVPEEHPSREPPVPAETKQNAESTEATSENPDSLNRDKPAISEAANGKISKAVNDVITKMGSTAAMIDEPPPTAPLPKADELIKEAATQATEPLKETE